LTERKKRVVKNEKGKQERNCDFVRNPGKKGVQGDAHLKKNEIPIPRRGGKRRPQEPERAYARRGRRRGERGEEIT